MHAWEGASPGLRTGSASVAGWRNSSRRRSMPDIAQLARDWARDPILWEPKLSRDGRWAAWTWTVPTEAGNVWLASTDRSAPMRRVTDERDHIYVRSFSPDGR